MDTTLLKELLGRKTRGYVRQGVDPREALRLAGSDILDSVRGRLAGVDLFCFKAHLRGAGRSILDSRGRIRGC